MNYFISPPEATDLKIDYKKFSSQISKQWSLNEINTIDNPQRYHSLEWEILIEDRLLIGSLDRTGQVIVLDGEISDVAKFAIWTRKQISNKYKLIFYDEGYAANIELRQDTSEAEIVNAFADV